MTAGNLQMKSSVGSCVLLSDMALFLQLAARLAAAPGSSPAFPPFLWASWRDTSPPQSEENEGGDPSMKDVSVRVLSCKTRRLLLVPRPSVRTSSPWEAVAVLATCRVVCGCVADGRLPQPAAFSLLETALPQRAAQHRARYTLRGRLSWHLP